MSASVPPAPGTGLPQSQPESVNPIEQHEDKQSSVGDKEGHSSFPPKDQSLSNVAIGVLLDDSTSLPTNQSLTNVAIGVLLDDSSEGSVSVFLDSANSSVNMRQNESDDENGGIAQEKSQGIPQELTSMLYRDIAIPHYSIPTPYHWDNHPEARSHLGSEDDDDDDDEEQQKTSSTQSQQGGTESTPFVIAHSRIGSLVSSHSRQNSSDHDNGIMRRLFTNNGSRLEPQSLVADSPMDFGTSRQGYNDYDGPVTTWEQFHDEPHALDYNRTVIPSKKKNKKVTWSGLEALPEDEYDPKMDVKQTSPDSKKRFLRETTGRGIGLVLCILGLVILISTGITISLSLIKNRYQVQVVESSLTPSPIPAPSEVPTRNVTTTPTIPEPRITFPPSGKLVVTVQVLNDGYVDFEDLILRSVQVQNKTTLLVQEGFNLSAALSFIEFDTVTTVGPLSALVPWLVSATIQLTLAEIDVDDIIRLDARLYPNTVAKQPYGDIIEYGSGQIDLQDGWIPFEISPNQTEMVDIDVTQFLQRHFDPLRTHRHLEDNDSSNVQVLLAHDNSDGTAVQGGSVRFFSSESASPSQRPRLILVLQAPDFSLYPAPTTAPIPMIGPTIPLNPTSSSKPSTSPSDSSSLHPIPSPEPTMPSYPSCSICGGLIFANPDTVITGVQNLTTCGIMQERALDGVLSPKQCQQLQSQVGETCCHPIDNNSFICDLCGRKLTTNSTGSVVNLDAVVSIPELGEVHTCRHYQERANAGMISSVQCSTLQPFTSPTCCGILL